MSNFLLFIRIVEMATNKGAKSYKHETRELCVYVLHKKNITLFCKGVLTWKLALYYILSLNSERVFNASLHRINQYVCKWRVNVKHNASQQLKSAHVCVWVY